MALLSSKTITFSFKVNIWISKSSSVMISFPAHLMYFCRNYSGQTLKVLFANVFLNSSRKTFRV
jgi:hypothetical protein